MSCNSTQHITKNCNLITFYPKETICLKHQFNLINTDRVYYDRNDSRKKNSLKDINKYVASLKRFILKNSKEIKALRKIIKGAEQKEKAEALQTIYSYNSDDGDAEELKNNLEELIPLGNEGEFEKKIEERSKLHLDFIFL